MTVITAGPEASALSRRLRTLDVCLIVGLLLLAIGFRYWRSPLPSSIPGILNVPGDLRVSDPPSMDETWHLALSTGRGSPFDRYPFDTVIRDVPAWTSMRDAPSLGHVWTSLDGVVHPPLYVLTLRWWRMLLGEGDGVAVAYSVAWSCVSLVFVYLAMKLAVGRTAAFWAGAVLAVAPAASYIALEIRGYAMLTAWAAIAIWLLVRLTLHGPRWRDVIGLSTVMLACMLTHYFAAPACLAAGVYALILSRRQWPRVLASGLAAAAIYAAVWLPFAIRQYRVSLAGTGFLAAPTMHKSDMVIAGVTLPLRLLADSDRITPAVAGLSVAILGGALLAARRQRLVRPMLVWGGSVALYLLATDLLRQTRQLAFIRYSAAILPAAVGLVPMTAAVLVRRSWAVHIAGIAACAFALTNQPVAIHGDAITLTPVLLELGPRLKADETVLIFIDTPKGSWEYITHAALLELSRMPGAFPRDAVLMHQPMSAATLRELRTRRAWLLNLSPAQNPLAIVPGARVLEETTFWYSTDAVYLGYPPQVAYLLELPAASTSAPSP